jgi:hypothetical protein
MTSDVTVDLLFACLVTPRRPARSGPLTPPAERGDEAEEEEEEKAFPRGLQLFVILIAIDSKVKPI